MNERLYSIYVEDIEGEIFLYYQHVKATDLDNLILFIETKYEKDDLNRVFAELEFN